MLRNKFRRVNLPCAGISRANVWESEQGFCVKAVRKPANCNALTGIVISVGQSSVRVKYPHYQFLVFVAEQ